MCAYETTLTSRCDAASQSIGQGEQNVENRQLACNVLPAILPQRSSEIPVTTATAPERLIQNLQDARLYPHPCGPIRVVETYSSWVVLTGAFAYKIKKPVDLGFVDLRSLKRRYQFCQREIALNRRLTPNVYQRVIAIHGTTTEPRLSGDGLPIEYAIQMLQFDDSMLLDRIVRSITGGQIDLLADTVAAFHKGAEVASLDRPFGRPEVLLDAAEQNFSEITFHVPRSDSEVIDTLHSWTLYQFKQLKGDFEQRRRGGMVRGCHGDMHLGNMFLEDGKPVVFDCVKYDSCRFIDVMNEVAFTVMDLASHDRSDLAYRFLNRWLERTGDYAGLRVLRFYLVYRAMARAKVACIRKNEDDAKPADADQFQADLGRYVRLAARFAQADYPKLIITRGYSGSGKTTGTQSLVERGAIRVRSDIERERLSSFGPGRSSGTMYSAEYTKRTYDQLAILAADIIEAGFTAIVDAAFLKKSQRVQFRELAFCLGVPFTTLDCQASEDALRIRERAAEGKDASEADESVLDLQLKTAEQPNADEPLILSVDRTQESTEA